MHTTASIFENFILLIRVCNFDSASTVKSTTFIKKNRQEGGRGCHGDDDITRVSQTSDTIVTPTVCHARGGHTYGSIAADGYHRGRAKAKRNIDITRPRVNDDNNGRVTADVICGVVVSSPILTAEEA